MFVSIRTKLIILIVLANALMVAVLLSINAITFSRSFSDYIEQQETRRLEMLLRNVGETYDSEGDWEWLRWDSPTWINTLRKSFAPGDIRSMDRVMSNGRQSGPAGQQRYSYVERLRIKDVNEQVLLGRKGGSRKTIWLPIESPQTRSVVAYLGFEPSSRLEAQFDELFASRLKTQLLAIGLFAFIIAVTLAFPFSGWLVKPIRQLTVAMRKMTDGNLAVAVDARRNDELGQLAENFNRLAEVLKQNHNDRQQWVSDIAHELRTPVAVLQADIEAAQDGVRSVDEKWLNSMHAHSDRLGRLVNDLHQLSQSDAGTLSYRFDTVDFADLTDDIIDQFKKTCQQHHIDIHWSLPATPKWLRGDDKRLTQLLSNLMQNTLRYTDGNAQHPGMLSIDVVEVEERIQLVWEDSSPGVGETDLPKLFDRLYRVDESRSRESGGSGLGLAIVKNIIEAHEGRISASQSALGGLKITVTLPKLQEHRV